MKRDLATPTAAALPFPLLLIAFAAVCLHEAKFEAAQYWFTNAIAAFVIVFFGCLIMDLVAPKR